MLGNVVGLGLGLALNPDGSVSATNNSTSIPTTMRPPTTAAGSDARVAPAVKKEEGGGGGEEEDEGFIEGPGGASLGLIVVLALAILCILMAGGSHAVYAAGIR